MNALRDLLAGAIDYAGLFPPAGLGMEKAVRHFATYRSGSYRWALGRLIVPVSKLDDFESAAAPLLSAEDPWPLSVLGGTDLAADLRSIRSFADRRRDAKIVSLEIKASSPAEIERAAAAIGGSIETFYEIPIADPPLELLTAVQKVRGRAKMRTGGTQAGSIPPTAQVARFLEQAHPRVAFKATAGLHHPLRCVRPLTYEPSSPTDRMHGFLNVFLAAAFVRSGLPGPELRELLEVEDPAHFKVDPSGISWQNRTLGRADLTKTRAESILSFGSCSFDEPIRELQEIGLL